MKAYKCSTNVSIYNKSILVEHDGISSIKINDQPHEMPHFSEIGSERLQHIDMMDFQSKLAMILRVKMKKSRIKLPLGKGCYGVEILIKSSRSLNELPLLETIKSVLDGLNKEIIENDSYVFSCKITYDNYITNRRTPKTRPQDFIDVIIVDLSTMTTIVNIQGLNIYIVPKRMPYVLNVDEDIYFYPEKEMYYLYIVDILKNSNFNVDCATSYSVNMHFCGDVISKDLDNMSKCYLPILTEGGFVPVAKITTLELNKTSTPNKPGFVELQISCNTM